MRPAPPIPGQPHPVAERQPERAGRPPEGRRQTGLDLIEGDHGHPEPSDLGHRRLQGLAVLDHLAIGLGQVDRRDARLCPGGLHLARPGLAAQERQEGGGVQDPLRAAR